MYFVKKKKLKKQLGGGHELLFLNMTSINCQNIEVKKIKTISPAQLMVENEQPMNKA